jgi:hypothetical protein
VGLYRFVSSLPAALLALLLAALVLSSCSPTPQPAPPAAEAAPPSADRAAESQRAEAWETASQPTESSPAQSQPAESRPAEPQPVQSEPAGHQVVDSQLTGSQTVDSQPAGNQPASNEAAGHQSVGSPSAESPRAAPPAAAPDNAAYQAIEQVVSELRGLGASQDVALEFMSPAQLRQYLLDAFDREYSAEERVRDHKLLVALGMIRPDQDLAALSLSVLGEQVLGMYDDETGRMYLIAEAVEPTASARVVFAHEYTHALQDANFDLGTLNPPDTDNDDRSAAIQALVEGDATLLMTLYTRQALSSAEQREVRREQSESDGQALAAAPLVLREELLFPYQDGLRFVLQRHRAGGFAAVDAAYRDPPASTEQVLHPEKYAVREAPVAVALPDLATALGGSWRESVQNTLGELDLRILVEQHSDRSEAERAAAGWGGDRYALLEDDQGRALVAIKSAWDTDRDASEFFQAYAQALERRFGPAARRDDPDPHSRAFLSPDLATRLVLAGREVLVVLAPDDGLAERARQVLSGAAADPAAG